MRYYNQAHRFYCGIDLHATTMYLCILDHAGQVVFHKDLPTNPEAFLEAIARALRACGELRQPGTSVLLETATSTTLAWAIEPATSPDATAPDLDPFDCTGAR
jgi:hypothetical protein